MATAPTDPVLRYLRRVTAAGPLPDGQLLERFCQARDDAAFALLVERHGPLVFGVCRRLLAHEQDAEDAFQATFLILARKAGSIRRSGSLASWLYGVAHHVAVRAQLRAARRRDRERAATERRVEDPLDEMTVRELRELLHAELARLPEKYRAPLVLCYLEGKSHEHAARILGWTRWCLRGRLERGRARLRSRFARRGLVLSAGILTLALSSATAAVPRRLTQATVRAAVEGAAGLVSVEVAALLRAAGRGVVVTRLRVLAGFLLAACLLAVGAVTHETPPAPPAGAPPPQAPGPRAAVPEVRPDTVLVRGRVLGPDGKPFPGAAVYLVYSSPRTDAPRVRATSGDDGRFRFTFAKAEVEQPSWKEDAWRNAQVVAAAPGHGPGWAGAEMLDRGELTLRLVRDDVPVTGRVLDLQGRPVAGASVRLRYVEATRDEDLAPRIEAGNYHPYLARIWVSGRPGPGLPGTLTTGRDGRFRLQGVGRERLVVLDVEGPTIESSEALVVTRPALAVQTVNMEGMRKTIHAASFDVVAGPTKPIEGTVRAADTGKPLAGVTVYGNDRNHRRGARAVTDERGHYRLAGLPKLAVYVVRVHPGNGQAYLPSGRQVGDSDGLEPLTADFTLATGVPVRVRLVDHQTGRVVRGTIQFEPLHDNPFLGEPAGRDYQRAGTPSGVAGADGTCRLVMPPGPGVLLATCWAPRNQYLPARLDPADRAKGYGKSDEEAFGLPLSGFNAYRVIRARPGQPLDVTIDLIPGRSVRGTVRDPDSKPLAGAKVRGLTFHRLDQEVLEGTTFEATGLDPDRPRRLVFLHAGRRLAAQVLLRGDEPQPFHVTLRLWGTVVGRVTDAEGRPLVGADVRLYYRLSERDPSTHEAIRPTRDRTETDREGRFRVEGLIPGLEYSLAIVKHERKGFHNHTVEGLAVQAGETKDLGQARARKFGP